MVGVFRAEAVCLMAVVRFFLPVAPTWVFPVVDFDSFFDFVVVFDVADFFALPEAFRVVVPLAFGFARLETAFLPAVLFAERHPTSDSAVIPLIGALSALPSCVTLDFMSCPSTAELS